MREMFSVIMGLILLLALLGPAAAAVTSEGELNAAITDAANPIEIGADITLTGSKTIGYAASLIGSQDQLYTLSGNGTFQLFNFSDNAGAISNLGFSGGNSSGGGAVYVYGGSINGGISQSTFSNNSASIVGGAVAVSGSINGGISQSTFSNNSAGYFGGAVIVYDSINGSISQSTFSNNSAGYGGGAVLVLGNLDLSGEGALFTGNQATGVAGEIYLGGGGAILFASPTGYGSPVKTFRLSATAGAPIVFEGNTHNPGQTGITPNSIYFGSLSSAGDNRQVDATFNVEEGGALNMLDPMASQEDNFRYTANSTVFSNIVLNIDKTGPGTWALAGHNDMRSATNWVVSEGALHLVADAGGAPAHINLSNTTNAMGVADYASFTLRSGASLLLEPAAQPHQISGQSITLEAGSSVGVQGFQYGPVLSEGRYQVLALNAESLSNQSSVSQTEGTITIGVNNYDYSNLAWDGEGALYIDVGQARQDPTISGTPAITGSSHIAAMNPASSTFSYHAKGLFVYDNWNRPYQERQDYSGITQYARADNGALSDMGLAGGGNQYLNRLWVTPNYVNANQSSNGDNSGYSLQTPGIALGYDRQVSEIAFMGIGISLSWPDYSGGGSQINANDITFALYGGMRLPYALELNGHAGFGFTRYNQDRQVMDGRYSSKYNGNNFFVGLGLGRQFDLGSGFSLRPGVAYDFIHLNTDGFDEGAGIYALKADDYSQSIHRVKAGLDLGWTESNSGFSVNGEVYYLGVYGDRDVATTGHFVNDQVNGFTMLGNGMDRDSLGLGLKVSLPVSEHWEFGVGYNVLLGADTVSQQGMLSAIFKF